MQRLDFVLPDFTRISWVTDLAREVWQPRITRITQAWIEIECLAVAAGVRRCCITMAGPEEFLRRGPEWARLGLNALPIEIQGISGQSYSATTVATELGKPFAFRFVLGAPESVIEFKRAWDGQDNEGIGRLLGYPECCLRFFRRVWVDEAMVDTTWPMAQGTTTPAEETDALEVAGPPQANILWRWMGVRAVSHLPCRFDCEATVTLADRLLDVGREAGYAQEMDWLLEILSWPVEWSALHGIAEIKTPVLKVSTRTDATARKYVVRREGTAYPAEGAKGLNFPYRMPRAPLLTLSRGFRRGLENPIRQASSPPAWYASDNGFPSVIAMEEAHQPIVALAQRVLKQRGGAVLDLGCGNGALLGKIRAAAPNVIPFGIECDPARLEHARTLDPEHAENFVLGDMFDSQAIWADEPRFALGILMPGRLLEVDAGRAEKLRSWLEERCDHLLVYAYGDWLTRYGDLRGLAQEAGFALVEDEASPVALAVVRRSMEVPVPG